jgi:ribonuclease D
MHFVDSKKALRLAIDNLGQADRYAIDTEADSLHHYYEKLCLLQISTGDEDYVIDPLSGIDLSELIKMIQKKPIICHGADFDIRILKRFHEFAPKEVFDTMMAAQFLGYPHPSLASLVDKHFRVHLSKTNQKADWSKRPLTPSMLEYAINDTLFLHRLRAILEDELRNAGRLEWFEESCHALIKSTDRVRETDPESQWRVKGYKELKDHELVILRELWYWREEEAKERDKPRFKVMSPDQMIRIAKWTFSNPDRDIKACPAVPKSLNQLRIASLKKAIKQAYELPISVIQVAKKENSNRRFSNKEKDVLKALKVERKNLADHFKIDPSLIVSNANMEQILASHPANPEDLKKLGRLLNWQLKLVTDPFLKIIKNDKD